VQLHPERRGDAGLDGKDRTTRISSMGSGQVIADPFLAFIRRAFWTYCRAGNGNTLGSNVVHHQPDHVAASELAIDR
jgi:hypothetical protein